MPDAAVVEVEVVVAWPRRHLSRVLVLPAGATAGDAVSAARFDGATMACVTGLAVHGEHAGPGKVLADGDRVELLRALQADPKVARRLRAERQRLR